MLIAINEHSDKRIKINLDNFTDIEIIALKP